jgi:signal transduction histidine kinase/CheY-like chemotaxis protein/CHASE3 domain sensor protein
MDNSTFKRILVRNLALPIGMSITLLAVFVLVVLSLLKANRGILEQDSLIERETETQRLISDSESGFRGYLLSGDEDFLTPFSLAKSQVREHLSELARDLSGPRQLELVQEVTQLYEEWTRLADASLQTATSSSRNQAYLQNLSRRISLMENIRERMEELQDASRVRRAELMESAEVLSRLSITSTGLLTLLLGAFLAVAGRRQLLGLSASYEEALSTLKTQTAELSRHAWIRSGQAELAENIREERAAAGLANGIVRFVAEYTGAAVGAVYFLRNEKRDLLERMGQYAYADEGTEAGKSFPLGEGLVGQAAADGKPLSLAEVPEEYVKVVSGTGQTKPRHLLIYPLLSNGETQGVLELAFVHVPDQKTRDLLQALSELAGGAIRALAYQERLQLLLRQSQELTEKLQTQQEELRVSNEELEERTRVLQDTQSRLESQHAELEQTNEQLEEQAVLLEEQKRTLDARNAALMEAQRNLEQKAGEVEAASRYKSEFLANMSHELRTPLNSSLILAKLLKDNAQGNLTPEQTEFASTIYSAGNDLLTLINDILDLSKVESGKMDIHPERVPVKSLLEQMERSFAPLAAQKNLELRVRTEPGAPEQVVTDRTRAEQVLRNLLSNAIKFTQKGYVELTVGSEGRKEVYFRVKDTGIGIAPSQQDAVFEAFRQADGTTSRKYGGTGLGLSISRTLASLLGGSLSLESAPGEGSTFTLLLPVETEAGTRSAAELTKAPHPQKKASEPQPPARVPDDRAVAKKGEGKLLLLVEDEPQYAKMLVEMARKAGFRCLVALTSEEGFQLAKDYSPRAIILDIRLPDGSGLALLDHLKRSPATRHIPVHGMSVSDYFREALHLGAAGFELKPPDIKEFRKTLAKIEERLKSRLKKVLLVEDDPEQRKSVERLISAKGVRIETVGSGTEALLKLGQQAYDCMIIDLKLPDMSGFELLERMTAQIGSTYPPVIVYSGRQLSLAEEERLYRYSRSIIIKSARSPERLIDEVTLFLHQADADLSEENLRMLQTSRNRERAFDGRTILVVDDDVRNVFALTNAIEMKGAKAVIARNGREALEKLSQQPEIDLVLMDVMMPEMDGLEATRRIRSSAPNRDVPVIAVTAKAMPDDYEKCLKAGANDYLAKPVDLDKLLALIRIWLPKNLVIS